MDWSTGFLYKERKEGRGYLLFEKLRDVKEKGVGEKFTVGTQMEK